MGFFKPTDVAASSRRIARVEALIWILIYAGLLLLVLGMSMAHYDAALAWPTMIAGSALAAIGVWLIYLRSKMNSP